VRRVLYLDEADPELAPYTHPKTTELLVRCRAGRKSGPSRGAVRTLLALLLLLLLLLLLMMMMMMLPAADWLSADPSMYQPAL